MKSLSPINLTNGLSVAALILSSASASAQTVTLPTSVGNAGQIITVVKSDASANTVSILTTSSQTIDGLTATRRLFYQNDLMSFQSDGANWHIIEWRINGAVPLTDAATIAVDCSLIPPGGAAKVILAGNRTLGAFTNYVKGQRFALYVRQDATGSRTLAYTATGAGCQRFSSDFPSPTLTTTGSKTDKIQWFHDEDANTFDCVGIVRGF